MADQKTTALTENTDPQAGDMLYIIDDPTGTPASERLTLTNLFADILTDTKVNVSSTTALVVEDDGTTDDVLVVDTSNGEVGIGTPHRCFSTEHTTNITAGNTSTVASFDALASGAVVGRILVAISQPIGAGTNRGQFYAYYFHADMFSASLQNLTLSSADYSANTSGESNVTVGLNNPSGRTIEVQVTNPASQNTIEGVSTFVEYVRAPFD